MPLLRTLRLIHVLAVAGLFGSLAAAVTQSAEPIFTERYVRSLERMTEKLGAPGFPLLPSQSALIVATQGASVSISVILPPDADPEPIARTLEAWGTRQSQDGSVLFSREDQGSIARWKRDVKQFGAWSAETRVDLTDLRRTLGAQTPTLQTIVICPRWAPLEMGQEATPLSRSTLGWNLGEQPSLPTVVAKTTIPRWMPLLLGLWLVLLPVGFVVIAVASLRVAKREDLALAVRRRTYGALMSRGVMLLLSVHAVIALGTLTTQMLEPISRLWLGIRFAPIGIIALGVGLLPLFLMLRFLNEAEYQLMRPTEEELAAQFQEVRSFDVAEPLTTQRRLLGFCLLFFSVALWFLPLFLPALRKSLAPILGALVLGLGGFALLRVRSKPVEVLPLVAGEPNELQRTLAACVDRMAARMGLSAPDSRVLLGPEMAISIDASSVTATALLVKHLSPAQLEFAVAHELAHRKLRHLEGRFFAILVLVGLIFFAGAFVGSNVLPSPYRSVALLSGPLVFALLPLVRPSIQHRKELAADRVAFEATRDLEAAASALKIMALNSPLPGVHDMDTDTHPRIAARIQALRAYAEGGYR